MNFCISAVHHAYTAWRAAGTLRLENISLLWSSDTEFEFDFLAVPCRKVAIVLDGFESPQTLLFETACTSWRAANKSSGRPSSEDCRDAVLPNSDKSFGSISSEDSTESCCKGTFHRSYGSWAKQDGSWSWRLPSPIPATNGWYETWTQVQA